MYPGPAIHSVLSDRWCWMKRPRLRSITRTSKPTNHSVAEPQPKNKTHDGDTEKTRGNQVHRGDAENPKSNQQLSAPASKGRRSSSRMMFGFPTNQQRQTNTMNKLIYPHPLNNLHA